MPIGSIASMKMNAALSATAAAALACKSGSGLIAVWSASSTETLVSKPNGRWGVRSSSSFRTNEPCHESP